METRLTASGLNPMLLKIALILTATLLLLWPLELVKSLISERGDLRGAALGHVADSVGHAQQIGAVMLSVAVTRTWNADGKTVSDTVEHHLLARDVTIDGSVSSAARHSGIYAIPTFLASLHVQGTLAGGDLQALMAPESGVVKQHGPIRLVLVVTDPSGIRSLDGIRVGGQLYAAAPVLGGDLKGVGVELPSTDRDLPEQLEFSFDLQLSGTERLQFLPFAASTEIDLRSPWPSPSFSGAFGPDDKTHIGAEGFAAHWHVLQLNRDYPQRWEGDAVGAAQIRGSAFGVDFYQPVDTYQRNYRALHYAFLFIALTFMVMFLLENVLALPLHPVQYAMTGAALAVFYLMLLAVSEHLSFGDSYALAAAALCALLGIYYSGVLRSRRAGVLVGLVSAGCYALIYLLILSEENALLFGALSLFAVLAAIMIATRRIDWYRLTAAR
jgi:inner membrane protein